MTTKPVWTEDQVVAQITRLDYQWQTPTVNYAFATLGAFNATEKAAAARAFQYVSDVVNLNFAEVAPGGSLDGKITFSNANLSAGLWGDTYWTYYTTQVNGRFPMSHAEIEVNTSYTGVTSSYNFGTYDFMSMFHEIGHALGEDHPGNYGEGQTNYDTYALYYQDSRQYTVMSYFNANNTGADHAGYYASTPLLDDVAALQALYGANTTTRTGDTIYGFNNTSGRDAFDFTIDTHPVVAIWDAGGNDTIDLSGYSMACKLNLNQGAFSDTAGMVGNIAVCFGAVIENGVGGSGDDQIVGNTANNTLSGGDGNDTLSPGAGNDTVNGGNGNDTFVFGANFNGSDVVLGGAGTDTLSLDGNYSSAITFSSTSVTSVEAINVAAGNSYNLVLNDGNVAAGATFTINGSALGSANALTVNGSAELDGMLVLVGGAGNDSLTGGGGADTIKGGAGADVLSGGNGNDLFVFDGGFSSSDQINGGAGSDTLSLNGDYGTVTFGASTMTGIETISFGAGHNYNLVLNNANLGAGTVLTVDGSTLGAGNALTLNGGNVTLGVLNLTGGAGADNLTGGGKADTLTSGAGNDTLSGGNGNDLFMMGANLSVGDVINGGASSDTIYLDGAYALAFSATMLTSVEGIHLVAGNRYTLTFDDANVASGARLIVNGMPLGAADTLVLDGSHETNGKFTFTGGAGADSLTGGGCADILSGGAGNDVLLGGAGTDVLNGGLGADVLNGGTGPDTFVYGSVTDSKGSAYDTLVGFDPMIDHIDIAGTVQGIDAAISTGALSAATFDTGMAQILDRTHFLLGHAVLVTADSGDLAGQQFLVVDVNGKAGYQAGKDLVLHLDSPTHLTSLDVSDFI